MSTNQPVIDTIFYNGNITTLDKANPTAQAVAISQGKFVAVGDDNTILAMSGSQTRCINLKGRRVLPGELLVECYKDGAYQWGITQCIEEAGVFLEYFFVESWQEHLRQHQRVSCADAMLQEEILGYLQPDTKPVVRHYLTARQG